LREDPPLPAPAAQPPYRPLSTLLPVICSVQGAAVDEMGRSRGSLIAAEHVLSPLVPSRAPQPRFPDFLNYCAPCPPACLPRPAGLLAVPPSADRFPLQLAKECQERTPLPAGAAAETSSTAVNVRALSSLCLRSSQSPTFLSLSIPLSLKHVSHRPCLSPTRLFLVPLVSLMMICHLASILQSALLLLRSAHDVSRRPPPSHNICAPSGRPRRGDSNHARECYEENTNQYRIRL